MDDSPSPDLSTSDLSTSGYDAASQLEHWKNPTFGFVPTFFDPKDQLCEACMYVIAQSLDIEAAFERAIADIKGSADRGCTIFHANISQMKELGLLKRDMATMPLVVVTKVPVMFTSGSGLALPTTLNYLLRPAEEYGGADDKNRNRAPPSSHGRRFQNGLRTQHGLSQGLVETPLQNSPTLPPNPNNGDFTPTRFLDLSMSLGDDADVIRLCDEKIDIIPKGTVILCKTFRDTIDVARRLGIDLIWFDSLCIIQDSADNWAHESARMQQVYGKSFLNIAAAASSNGRGGCYRTRNPQTTRPVMVDYEEDGRFYLTDIDIWWKCFQHAPLNNRAWVVQERLLSPRNLMFDANQLVWECGELTACERFPKGLDNLVPSHSRLRPASSLEDVFRSAVETGLKARDIVVIWKPIVEKYSACKLTNNADRLIALHGAVMRIKQVLGCQYPAGLFSRDMESQMLWEVEDNRTASRPESHVAPSWSWASVVRPVKLLPQWDQCTTGGVERHLKPGELGEQALCEVLNKETLGTSRQDTTPWVSRAALQIRSYLCPILPGSPHESPFCSGGHFEPHVIVNSLTTDNTLKTSAFCVRFLFDMFPEEHEGPATPPERLRLMPVYLVTERKPLGFFDMTLYCSINGLVLELEEEEQDGQNLCSPPRFKRRGTFKIPECGSRASRGCDAQWAFWQSCLEFKGVENTKMDRLDGVLVPKEIEDTDDSDELRYEKDQQYQYVVTVV
ncbi:heterokaryon incompatibility protein-domain-containing protein [Apodospora peruviana]|uniref:Heterokaryon incompatibility protein-domain-containing protein n=1 Tax=Apodospora peruviana TaxID=516989 RepID=A0AAE0M1M7_9PEZI|nr:heterokaryon incompatibility protein-domain-containing protein [Apodospora peruviana]